MTAEVRIHDVINSDDVDIYRELAGGTTTANVLHGSSNAIGGQSAVVKRRWGGGPDELLLAGAPEGIKFALGENPKQSNFANPRPRYPATRMGVEDPIRERFPAARDYRKRRTSTRRPGTGVERRPPRRDLQLEAIVEILEGKRFIHCHSYRQDEILMLIRVAEEFGVRSRRSSTSSRATRSPTRSRRTAPARSTFSDWWAYKFEV